MIGHLPPASTTHASESSLREDRAVAPRADASAFDQAMIKAKSKPPVPPKPAHLQGIAATHAQQTLLGTMSTESHHVGATSATAPVTEGISSGKLSVYRTDSRPPHEIAGPDGKGMIPFQWPKNMQPTGLLKSKIENLRNPSTGRLPANPLRDLAVIVKRGGEDLAPHQISTALNEAQAIPGSSGRGSHLYKLDLPFTHYHLPASGGRLDTKPINDASTLTALGSDSIMNGQALLSNNPHVSSYDDLRDGDPIGLFHNNHPYGGNGEISVFGEISGTHISHTRG